MSVQFGRWNFEGQLPAPDYIEKVNATLAPYGPDSDESYSKGSITMLYRAFHTTNESRREKQPHISLSGTIITWDGRLDNRSDLINELRPSTGANSTDIAIVAAAYEKWGTNCLGKLTGDWALSIWNPRERLVLLAKDPVGTRHLYYSFDHKQLTWSTVLDPLVLFAEQSFEVCEEYIAGWLAIPVFPREHLTPYVGVHSVPPSASMLFQPGKQVITKYWDFDPGKCIRYRADTEYEEHFRSVLAAAVQRRLRSDRPVLAELSGGMDSSSIVCIADTVIREAAECARLDTISWFDNSYDHLEPDSNELHWICKVEEKRGRTGCHINLGEIRTKQVNEVDPRAAFTCGFDNDRFAAIPIASDGQSEFFIRYKEFFQSQGYRVTLSGIGGDEPTGGAVPSPTPELQNLLARARFVTFASQLSAWALKMRKSRLSLLREAAQGFFSAGIDVPNQIRSTRWLHSDFVRRNRAAFCGYPLRVKLFGSLPSFQENIAKLESNRRFVAYCRLAPGFLREVRYPYYDRDFLEFMYAIPREQIVRVGQRRSLMKRALKGIVPDELLTRRRKTFVPPEQRKKSAMEWARLVETEQAIIGDSVRIIHPDHFIEALQKVRHNEDVAVEGLRRVATLECWLRHLASKGLLTHSMSAKSNRSAIPEVGELQRKVEAKRFAS